MNHVVIPRSRIREFLNELKLSYRVVAPVNDGRTLEFKEFQSAEQVCLTDEVTYKSPKEFLFPQVEKFLCFDEKGGVSDESQVEKTLIFGVRPCDLEAIKILTAVFTKGKFVDTLFANRLKNTIIIGLGCISKKPGCFCSDRGIDKSFSSECDIFLVDDGDSYLAQPTTEKGETIIKEFLIGVEAGAENSFNSCMEMDMGAIKHNTGTCKHGAGHSIGDEKQDEADGSIEGKLLELSADENILFDKVDWDRISETCIGCGTCTYICPTCHCFDFKDVAEKGVASRYRCWDSCMYPKFTLHTSGHNPRPTKKERYRQRIMHKYVYVKKNFGYIACTGCGRCVRSCPAGVNIKSVVKRIMEELM